MADKKKKKYDKMDAENKALVKNNIEMNPTLKEAKGKTVVFGWGRMNPVTIGHEKLADKLKSVAQKERATPLLYLSHSTDPKKNPLSYDDKIMLARKAFGDMVQKSNAKTIIQAMKELDKKFDSVILIVGQDRVQEFDTLLNKYNGKEYNFDSINVVSAGDRDPDADDVTGMSASKMRALAAQGVMKQFAKGLPKKLKGDAQAVYDMVRAGMKLAEELEAYENLDEALSLQQRRQRAITMRRYKAKIAAARKRMARRPADQERLEKRAEKKARSMVRAKIAGSKGKNYDDLSPAEKSQIEDRVKKRSVMVARIAKRLLPKLKRADTVRIAGKSVEPIKEATSEVERLRAKQAADRRKLRDTQERGMDSLRSRQMRRKIRSINVNEHIEVENDLEALQIIEQVASLYEAKRVKGGDPCWDGYEMVGKKKKNGKEVPNCVPKEEVEVYFTKDDLFEMRLDEAVALDKILDAVHRNVKAGKNLMDIAFDISRAAGVTMSGQEIRRAYVAKFGEPKTGKESNPEIRAKLLKKYGLVKESVELSEGKVVKKVNGYDIHDMGADFPYKHKRFMVKDLRLDVWQAGDATLKGAEAKAKSLKPSQGPDAKKTQAQIDHDDWRDKQKARIASGEVRRAVMSRRGMKEGYDPDGYDPAKSAGAGLQGTDRLQKRYKKDTPGEVVDGAKRKDINEAFSEMMEQKSSCDLVGIKQIKEFEKVVDKLFEKFGIDFQFTKHFADRMGDERNDPCITLKELADFIKKIYKNQGKSLKGVAGAEAVVRDLQRDLNIPVVVKYDQKNDEFDVVMKTIMRKKNFKTPNKVIDYK